MKGIKLIRRKPYVITKDYAVTVPKRFRKLHDLSQGSKLYQYITRDGDLLLSVRNYQSGDDHE